MAIDPGPAESAWVRMNDGELTDFGKFSNDVVNVLCTPLGGEVLVIELIESSYGMPVGKEVFQTVFWAGRFAQSWSPSDWFVMNRKTVVTHICGTAKAKDSNVRAALIDRWGGKDKAIGTKAKPGPLKGVTADVWQALALGITWSETQARRAA